MKTNKINVKILCDINISTKLFNIFTEKDKLFALTFQNNKKIIDLEKLIDNVYNYKYL